MTAEGSESSISSFRSEGERSFGDLTEFLLGPFSPQSSEADSEGVLTPVPLADEQEAAVAQVVAAARQRVCGPMTPSQERWCSPARVRVYLRARKGVVPRAADALVKALHCCRDYEEILSGTRVPRWQGDFRVLTRADDGHPLVYMCYRHQPARPSTKDFIDHVVAVLEAAIGELRHGADRIDVVLDCHGFRLSSNLDPRPALHAAQIIKQLYRDRLRSCLLVDAPTTFDALWRAIRPVLKPDVRQRIRLASAEEAARQVERASGTQAAAQLRAVMAANRAGGKQPRGGEGSAAQWLLPSELGFRLGGGGGQGPELEPAEGAREAAEEELSQEEDHANDEECLEVAEEGAPVKPKHMAFNIFPHPLSFAGL